MQITIYRAPDGALSLDPADGLEPIEATLGDGYRVEAGFNVNRRLVFGKPGALGLTAEDAARRGVLRVRAVAAKR
jgi:hypothetical protein